MLATTVEDKMMIIDQRAKYNRDKATAKMNADQDEWQVYHDKIMSLENKIKDLITLANYLMETGVGIPISGQFGNKSSAKKYGYDADFMAEGFYHNLGFKDPGGIRNGNWNKATKIKYLAIINGGACGVIDLLVGGDIKFCVSGYDTSTKNSCKARTKDMKQFINQFEDFEAAFYNYIDSLEVKED